MGKIDTYQTDHSVDYSWVDCQLVAGSDPATHDVDSAGYTLAADSGTTLPMHVIHTFDSIDNASIQCRDFDKGSSFEQSSEDHRDQARLCERACNRLKRFEIVVIAV